jgi:hypothetical protein
MLDLLLEDADGCGVWRGPLPPHVAERLIADTQMAGILVGRLPNDGAPLRLDAFTVETDGGAPRLRVEVASGGASYAKIFLPALALRDDAEVIVGRLLAAKELAAGSYRFRCLPRDTTAEPGGTLRIAPLARRLAPLARHSLWGSGLAALPSCRHPTILLPRARAEALVAHARSAPAVEVGALLVVEPFIADEAVPCRLGIRVLDVVPLAHGTSGTEMHLRVTPEALAAVPVDEERGRCRGGMAHSHVFGDRMSPHFLSTDDKAVATGWFWRPFGLQIVMDPRFVAPEDALAAFCWVDGSLGRVCLQLVDERHMEESRCLPSAPPS